MVGGQDKLDTRIFVETLHFVGDSRWTTRTFNCWFYWLCCEAGTSLWHCASVQWQAYPSCLC
jgi:hypothetical protein